MQAIKKLFKKLSGRENALPEEREKDGMNEEIFTEELIEAEESLEADEAEEDAMTEERPPVTERIASAEATAGNRNHLTSSVPRSAKAPLGVLTKSELGELREIFSGLSDTEIQRLYKRVTKKH